MFWNKALICCLIAAGMPAAPLCADLSPAQEAALEEMQVVVRALRAENEQLRERNRMLTNEIIRLRRLLTEPEGPLTADSAARRRDDRPEAAEPEEDPAPPPLPGFEILYVNPTWHYVIFDGGSDDDLAVGNRGRLMRKGAEIGQATVTAVKPGQSVADLDLDSLQGRGHYPRESDRILFLPTEIPEP